MRSLLLGLLLLCAGAPLVDGAVPTCDPTTAPKQIPDRFFGKFVLERSENFDEYLQARGVNWILRKLISFQTITKVIEKAAEPDRYNFYNFSPESDTTYEKWALGEEFVGVGFDSKKHKITFAMCDANTLTEKHIREENDPPQTYYYAIEGDYLVLTLTHADVTSRRFMKRQ